MPMYLNPNRILHTMAAATMAITLIAGAQTPAPQAPAPAPASAPTPAAAPAPADQPAAAPAAPADAPPTPLSTFVLTGPLQWLPPATFDAGPLG